MDVLSQALSVVKLAESGAGPVTLTFDLEDPAHKAAYAAALAVLRINGVDPAQAGAPPTASEADDPNVAPAGPAVPETQADSRRPATPAVNEVVAGSDDRDAPVRRSYAEALAELTPDVDRQRQVLNDTYARVRDLLRDGANVEAVAQVQYRRWSEEHLDTSRN